MRKIVLVLLASMFFTMAVQAEQYTVGVVPQFDARQIRETWLPILNHLGQDTGHSYSLVQAPSIPVFEKMFENGDFDFVYLNPYHMLLAEAAQRYRPILRDPTRMLKGIVVVKREDKATDLEWLENETIAFPAPKALGATLFVRSDFQSGQINIKPKYVGNHDSVYLNVALGLTRAGGGVVGTFRQQKKQIQDRLRILHTTESSPAHPVAVHPRVSKDAVEAFVKAFENIHKLPQGKIWLSKVPMKRVTRTSIDDYRRLGKLGLERLMKSSAE